MRSLLFVPGDSARKLDKALGCGADALIVDLEDSVAPDAKAAARVMTRDFLHKAKELTTRSRLFVRVNALDSGLVEDDLDAIAPAMPDGIMLPKAQGGADIQQLGVKIAVREAEHDIADGATRIIAIATETAAALFTLGSYAGASRRLAGLAWGAEDLSAALGAETNRRADGAYADPYRLARTLTLAGARAADVLPIDTVFTDFRDMAGLAAECDAARRDGFAAKLAIHPAQVATINASFTPSDAAVAQAQRIVEAFERAPGSGVVTVDGRMVDRPHLIRAQQILARRRI